MKRELRPATPTPRRGGRPAPGPAWRDEEVSLWVDLLAPCTEHQGKWYCVARGNPCHVRTDARRIRGLDGAVRVPTGWWEVATRDDGDETELFVRWLGNDPQWPLLVPS